MGLLRRTKDIESGRRDCTATVQPRRASTELTDERMASAQARAFPGVVIAGCQRCGTTSLYWNLAKHPLVLQALVKEVHFFDVNWIRGERWYRAHFPTLQELKDAGSDSGSAAIAIEASPYYIFHPDAPRRIATLLHDTKFIVLVRNPVDRAFSNWRRQVQKQRESLSFEEAIDEEPARLAGERERILADAGYEGTNWRWYSYLSRGHYAEQLAEFVRHVPRERLLVLIAEDLANDPQAVYQRTLEFLRLPDFAPPVHEHRNRSSGSSLSDRTRAKLVEHYRPHNRRLYEWLGDDLRRAGWDA